MPGVIPAGVVSEQLINHVDLFPTIARLVDASSGLPDDLSGQDLSGAILGKEPGRKYTFTMEGLVDDSSPPDQLMARSPRWKLVRFYIRDGETRHVLYDMDNDPYETRNVADDAQNQEVLKQHQLAMDRFMASLKPPQFDLEPRTGAKIARD
jgi:arylsulfatase A-like enzyme